MMTLFALKEMELKEVEQAWPPMDAQAHRRHLAGIRALCDELDRSFDEVAAAYQRELLLLAAHAAVMDYLPVLVCKHVRALYRQRLRARAIGDPCARLLARV